MVLKIENNKEQSIFLDLKPVQSQKVSENIYEQIKEKIISGELKPNDRLPSERSLIDIFGRSRPTIREALRMLESAGFIETLPGRGGAMIKEITPDIIQQPLENIILLKGITIKELYEFRIVNETAFIQWAAERRTDEDLITMEKIIDDMYKAEDDWDKVIRLDAEFHGAIVDSAKNEMAKIVHQVISQPIIDIFHKEFANMNEDQLKKHLNNIVTENAEMLKIIKEKNPVIAKKKMIEHLEKFNRFIK